MKELLEAGVHFGHQTRRWDPRMKSYIFTERNGIHIIDLQKTIAQLKITYNAIKETVKNGGVVLFVGTKKQAQAAVVQEATRCGMPYVSNRWLGGMITNFVTIKNSINRLKRIERMEVDGSFEMFTKKEVIRLQREKEKLLKNIGGIKDMENLPDMIFIIDPRKEAIAVAEANKAKIPIVAIVDTNCNPEGIDYPVPGNDDAIRAINLFCSIISSAVIEGQTEAGKLEITEEIQIISLADEEEKVIAKVVEEEEEGYISEEAEESLSDRERIEQKGEETIADSSQDFSEWMVKEETEKEIEGKEDSSSDKSFEEIEKPSKSSEEIEEDLKQKGVEKDSIKSEESISEKPEDE